MVIFALMIVTTLFQYNSTFLSTYVESGVRRRALAEKLRRLPLSFFGKKDLSDLTNAIMPDCALIETASSHWIPGLIGSMISTAIIVIRLLFFNWRMALAEIWVMPIALENIRIGKKEATDAEVMEAARLANCTEFIEKLPDKWNTLIGENGSELSGGERQRISIARAFLKDAPIILMDEATASLDVDNESVIQESISKLIQNKTVFIIAHRMRTVDGVDKIVVLKDGVVAESGTPEELKEQNGIYKHMVEVQLETEQWKYR